MVRYKAYYSQNREDLIIEGFFPDVKNGFYVDVGANHPFYHSVTKIFYDKGWHGINLEPNPMLLNQLQEHRPKDINLMLGIGDKPGKLSLRVYHSRDGLEGISTLSQNMKKGYSVNSNPDTKKYSDIEIDLVTLKQLFNEQKPQHIHFLKVDVEGFEHEVLKGNDWNKYRPEMICIESNHMIKDWRPILRKAKYQLVFNDGINDYYLALESIFRKDYFDYVDIFLSNKPAISYEVYSKLERIAILERELENVRQGLDVKIHKIEDLKREIEDSRRILEEITPLRKHIKRQVKRRIEKTSNILKTKEQK